MNTENTVFELEEGESVGCHFCIRNQEFTQYGKGQAFLAGPSHTPHDGQAHHICRKHLDSDAEIHQLAMETK